MIERDPAKPDPFVHNLVLFVRHLRSTGLRVPPQATRDLITAISAVGLHDRDDLYHAFSALLVVRPSDREVFDEAFEAFFGEGLLHRGFERDTESMPLPGSEQSYRLTTPVLADLDGFGVLEPEETIEEVVGGSYQERLSTRDFSQLTPEQAEEVRRLIATMMWRPADTASRRWQPNRSGIRPDLRRTLRGLTGPEGDLLPLAFSAKRVRRRPLIVLADISGSMERYTEMFLHFVHAAQGRLGRVESFVFATRLTRITREMRRRTPAEALERVASAVEDWSGGTRIGGALHTFNWQWSRRVGRGGAICMVISDGWDTGDPHLLDEEMGRLARSVHRVIWLNPLAGRPGYQPETRGMRTVLPYVDDFLAVANLVDLRAVVRLLESVPRRRGRIPA